MPPFHRHHGHHHGHHGPRGLVPPLGALLVGGMIGGAIASTTRPPPPSRYRRGERYRQVIIVEQVPEGMAPLGTNEQLVCVSCPIGARPGDPLELEVAGQAYSIVVPQVREGQNFYVRIPKRAAASVKTPQVVSSTQLPTPPTQQQQQHAQQPVYQARSASQPQQQQQQSMPTADVVDSSSAVEAEAQVVGVMPTYAPANPFMDDNELDDWIIAPQKVEFDGFFSAAGPIDKAGTLVLSPTQVRNILLPTGLAKEILRNVWELSDIDKDGTLDSDEFAVAMYLCRESLAGKPMPSKLPNNVCKHIPLSLSLSK
mmetsp:Transcript_14097/g.18318  ORF Transcript_14097/g.18318 Transcript_14097/m.18318 type:complete len:313 (-) Transcript_14097:657-1595(-)